MSFSETKSLFGKGECPVKVSVDHHVENLAGLLVAILARTEKFSTQGRSEFLDRRLLKPDAPSRFGLVCHDVFSSLFPRPVAHALTISSSWAKRKVCNELMLKYLVRS